MESRFFLLLVAPMLALGLAACAHAPAVAVSGAGQPPVIDPEVARRDVKPVKIPTQDFELGVFAGEMSVEDFGVHVVQGARFAYHVNEKYFVELAAGQTTAGLTSFERLSGAAQLLTDDERDYSYYNASLGYNLLPGEGFLGPNRALNTQLYVIGGVGKTKFAGDDRFTINVGLGLRVLPLDWLAVHADVRDHVFDVDLLGQPKTTHNLEGHIGVTFFF
ncbi:MAG TPA: outer membrane beta-barrel domain-containing protein [Gammaproteobacteria bacterium]|nr:outer membrane beta-barrel domain-containing protein [Gammaproteobacteria bacterium]